MDKIPEERFKIQYRKVYDDNSSGDWHRWSSKVYINTEFANQALNAIQITNNGNYFNTDKVRFWKYEFRIIEHSFCNSAKK